MSNPIEIAGQRLKTYPTDTEQQFSLLPLDGGSAIPIIDYPHKEIHSGDHFVASHVVTGLDTSDAFTMLIITPNTLKWDHVELFGSSDGKCRIEMYSAPTTSANGTAVPIWNRNLNSDNTPTMAIYHTPTVSADGVKIEPVTLWFGTAGGRGQAGTGGAGRSDGEIILKQNTKYLVRFTAEADAMRGKVGIDWYEHEG